MAYRDVLGMRKSIPELGRITPEGCSSLRFVSSNQHKICSILGFSMQLNTVGNGRTRSPVSEHRHLDIPGV